MCFENGCLASSCPRALVLVLHTLQHGRVLQHVWQDQEANLASTDVDLLELSHAAVPVGYGNVGHLKVQKCLRWVDPQDAGSSPHRNPPGTNLTVHVVFSLNQLATVHLSRVGLTGDDVSFCLMQDLDGDADGHLSTLVLKNSLRSSSDNNATDSAKTASPTGGQTEENLRNSIVIHDLTC